MLTDLTRLDTVKDSQISGQIVTGVESALLEATDSKGAKQ